MNVFSGDQVLEWNGRVLQGATFNEVYNIILESKSEAQVELVVSRLIRWVPREPAILLCRNALLSFFCRVFLRDVHRVADGTKVVQMNSSEFITQEDKELEGHGSQNTQNHPRFVKHWNMSDSLHSLQVPVPLILRKSARPSPSLLP